MGGGSDRPWVSSRKPREATHNRASEMIQNVKTSRILSNDRILEVAAQGSCC
jgi:hypothetical protein